MNKVITMMKSMEIKCGISIAFFLAFTFSVFAPFEIYLSNKDSLFFSGYELIPVQGLIFVFTLFCCFVLFLLIYFLINKWFYPVVTLFFSSGLSLYIQGNFIPMKYGELNGEPIEWSNFKLEGLVSIVAFVLPICISVFIICEFYNKSQTILKLLSIVAICITLVQIVTLSTLLISKNGLSKDNMNVLTTENELSLSKDQNFIILLLDTFDAQQFQTFLDGDSANHYLDLMDGFSFYPNTVGSFSSTDLAIPQIITGEYYQNDKLFGEYLNDAYASSTFMKRLNEEQWNISIYTDCIMPQGDSGKYISNLKNAELTVTSHKRLSEYMYLFAGFRYLPQPLKRLCWFYPDDINSVKSLNHGQWDAYNIFNESFYPIINQMNANQKNKTYQFYHLEGTHSPYTTRSDMTVGTEDVGIETESTGVWLIIERYIQTLKQLGIYDNSIIVIMSDHGTYDLRQNPLFMVKGYDERHEMIVSHAPMSYADLSDIYDKLLNDSLSDSLIDFDENVIRERFFYKYLYTGNINTDAHATIINEYTTNGDASQIDTFDLTGKVFEYKK